jgi:hypothetical protein
MSWPPRIGERLPRATDAWCAQSKLHDWILGEEGHGDEWRRVFHVGAGDGDLVWDAIAEAVLKAPITGLRGKGSAVTYGVLLALRINDRVALVLTAWHYEDESAAPRLVTAYPKPYTRRNGDHG